jgi:Flp pilus assembly pilin Flp
MLIFLNNKRGQSTAEYAILIGVVIAAVIGMQAWVRRSISGKIHDAALNAGTVVAGYPTNLFTTDQFEPGSTSTMVTERSGTESIKRTEWGGEITRTFTNEKTNRTGNITNPALVTSNVTP